MKDREITPARELRELKASRDKLAAALKVIELALGDGDGGSYWPARKFLDDRGIYNGDLNDLRVLSFVAKVALSHMADYLGEGIDNNS